MALKNLSALKNLNLFCVFFVNFILSNRSKYEKELKFENSSFFILIPLKQEEISLTNT